MKIGSTFAEVIEKKWSTFSDKGRSKAGSVCRLSYRRISWRAFCFFNSRVIFIVFTYFIFCPCFISCLLWFGCKYQCK